MNILTSYFTASRLFTFVRRILMYVEFNSVALFTVLYSRFMNCAKDVSKVTAQPTILEYHIWHMVDNKNYFKVIPTHLITHLTSPVSLSGA